MPKTSAAAAAKPAAVAAPVTKVSCSFFGKAAPPPVRKLRAGGGGGGAALSAAPLALVVGKQDQMVSGSRGPTKKIKLSLVVSGIEGRGAQDVIVSGVSGENYLLPSKPIETPVSQDSSPGFKSKDRELDLSQSAQPAKKLSLINVSLYAEAKDGAAGAEPGVNAAQVGSYVTISGLHAQFGSTNAVYLNALGCKVVSSAPASLGEIAEVVVKHNRSSDMQQRAAFAASVAAGGFFDTSGLNDQQKIQAEACQALWNQVCSGTADRLKEVALGKSPHVEVDLETHVQRVRGVDPKKLSSGRETLWALDKYDQTICPLLMSGATPWDPTPTAMRDLLACGPEAAKLPSAFLVAANTNVVFSQKGNAVTVEFGGVAIYDKRAALEAVEAGLGEPWLAIPCIHSTTLMMSPLAEKLGNRNAEKAKMAINEIMPYTEEASFAKITPHESDGGHESQFAEGNKFIDVPRTLAKTGILVDEDFIKQQLCGGGNTFVVQEKDADAFSVDPDVIYEYQAGDKGCTGRLPGLKTHFYKELTAETCSLANFQDAPAKTGRALEYRVLYQGCCSDISGNQSLVSDAAAGAAHLADVQAMQESDSANTMLKFLASKCLVYAVLAAPAADAAMQDACKTEL